MPAHPHNVVTRQFPSENDKGGLMICGINWGGEDTADESGPSQDPSFFSDLTVTHQDHSYQRRLIKWFEILGHRLGTRPPAGTFERSIFQTNWCSSVSRNMSGKDIARHCTENHAGFINVLRNFQPALVVLAGSTLLGALLSRKVRPKVEFVLGKQKGEIELLQDRGFYVGGKKHTAFKLWILRFEKGVILVLPHPTGARGLSDEYIKRFRDKLGGAIGDFKTLKRITPAST